MISYVRKNLKSLSIPSIESGSSNLLSYEETKSVQPKGKESSISKVFDN